MTKKKFIECVSDLREEMRRLADHAEQIIYMELEKHGDMSKDFLFGDEEDFDKVWLDDGRWLTYIERDSDFNIKIGTSSSDDNGKENYLIDMDPSDRIEIADFLCRR